MVATIERMYAAVGRDDREGLNGVLTSDFHAFENGVAMSGSDLLKLMSQLYAGGKRYRWSVTSPQVEVQGNQGAVVYLNIGSVVEAPGAEPGLQSVAMAMRVQAARKAVIGGVRVSRRP